MKEYHRTLFDRMRVSQALRKLLRRIPLSLFAALLGLAAGLGLWEIIDATQKNAVRELYEQQLQENLEQRARETLIHFDHSLNSYNLSLIHI